MNLRIHPNRPAGRHTEADAANARSNPVAAFRALLLRMGRPVVGTDKDRKVRREPGSAGGPARSGAGSHLDAETDDAVEASAWSGGGGGGQEGDEGHASLGEGGPARASSKALRSSPPWRGRQERMKAETPTPFRSPGPPCRPSGQSRRCTVPGSARILRLRPTRRRPIRLRPVRSRRPSGAGRVSRPFSPTRCRHPRRRPLPDPDICLLSARSSSYLLCSLMFPAFRFTRS